MELAAGSVTAADRLKEQRRARREKTCHLPRSECFLSFPQTKTYFSHFDLSQGSADLQRHGGKILGALVQAAKHLDNLDAKNDNADTRKVMYAVSLHTGCPAEFDATTHAAFDKFLAAVSHILTSKYK
ncbi:hemoglobin subunit alpha-3-like [Dendropsophus ebraccatus]|uniref:hemoglobin subunit alpha-3-like n=1 Tax=Dendropsophus ebraccatus TaxID=150705 RepID=UPI0038322CFF